MLRPATLNDSLNVCRLRNEKIVRQNSRCQKEFDYCDYQVWFWQRLDQYLIVEIKGKFAGYIRVADNVVSIALIEEFRGKGLAAGIIRAVIKEGWHLAYINESNAPSIKAFEGAGFELTGTDGEFGIYSCRA